jgi:hypothetical protein
MLIILGTVAGCVQDPSLMDDVELTQLIEAYRKNSAEVAEAQSQRERATIRYLQVERRGPSDVRVSADLAGALIDLAVAEILERSGAAYNLGTVRLWGRATVRFADMPLRDALNEIMNPQGISVALERGLLKFQNGVPLDPQAAETLTAESKGDDSTAGQTVYREVSLSYLDAGDAMAMLTSLFADPNSDDSDSSSNLTFGTLSELNALFISGPPERAAAALAVLNRSDREVPHTLIEAIMVDIDIVAAAQLGAQLEDLAYKAFSGVTLLPSTGTLAGTFVDGAQNNLGLTASIDLLVSQNKAQVLSRSYIAARSRQKASLEVVDEQFVSVQAAQDGASITTTDGISAGVILSMTPAVLADGSIRLDLQMEDSQFLPVAGDTLVAKDRRTASTSMTVRDGQTIVIGGLKSKVIASQNEGLPWLRKVPLLNLFTAEQRGRDARREVILYLTPHVWRPGLDVPLLRPDLPAVESHTLTPYEVPGFLGSAGTPE